MKSTVDLAIKPPLPTGFAVREDQLPIGSFEKFLQEKRASKYNLRASTKDKEFLVDCTKLVEKCYEALFFSSENNQENQDKKENNQVNEDRKEESEDSGYEEQKDDCSYEIEKNFEHQESLEEEEDPLVNIQPLQSNATTSKRYKSSNSFV